MLRMIYFLRNYFIINSQKHWVHCCICTGGNYFLTVIGFYCPPSVNFDALEHFGKWISSYASSELLSMGDINLDWLSVNSSRLKELCTELNLLDILSKPTRQNVKNPAKSTLIDVILTNKPHKYLACGIFAQYISDHRAIACIRDTRLPKFKLQIILKRN